MIWTCRIDRRQIIVIIRSTRSGPSGKYCMGFFQTRLTRISWFECLLMFMIIGMGKSMKRLNCHRSIEYHRSMPTPPQRLRSGFYQGTFNRSTRVNFGFFCVSVVFFHCFFFSRFDRSWNPPMQTRNIYSKDRLCDDLLLYISIC